MPPFSFNLKIKDSEENGQPLSGAEKPWQLQCLARVQRSLCPCARGQSVPCPGPTLGKRAARSLPDAEEMLRCSPLRVPAGESLQVTVHQALMAAVERAPRRL